MATDTSTKTQGKLTKRQQEIYDFIRKYSAKYGYPPTVRDIGKAVGLASSSTVRATSTSPTVPATAFAEWTRAASSPPSREPARLALAETLVRL